MLQNLFRRMPGAYGAYGSVTVVPDDRLNSLVVYATRTDRNTIEGLLKVLDSAEVPSSMASERLQLLPVKNASAAEMERMLQDLYGDQIESMSVEDRTNSLIVVTSPPVFEQLRRVVAMLDEAAGGESSRSVQIVRLQKASSERVEEALNIIFPKTAARTARPAPHALGEHARPVFRRRFARDRSRRHASRLPAAHRLCATGRLHATLQLHTAFQSHAASQPLPRPRTIGLRFRRALGIFRAAHTLLGRKQAIAVEILPRNSSRSWDVALGANSQSVSWPSPSRSRLTNQLGNPAGRRRGGTWNLASRGPSASAACGAAVFSASSPLGLEDGAALVPDFAAGLAGAGSVTRQWPAEPAGYDGAVHRLPARPQSHRASAVCHRLYRPPRPPWPGSSIRQAGVYHPHSGHSAESGARQNGEPWGVGQRRPALSCAASRARGTSWPVVPLASLCVAAGAAAAAPKACGEAMAVIANTTIRKGITSRRGDKDKQPICGIPQSELTKFRVFFLTKPLGLRVNQPAWMKEHYYGNTRGFAS